MSDARLVIIYSFFLVTSFVGMWSLGLKTEEALSGLLGGICCMVPHWVFVRCYLRGRRETTGPRGFLARVYMGAFLKMALSVLGFAVCFGLFSVNGPLFFLVFVLAQGLSMILNRQLVRV